MTLDHADLLQPPDPGPCATALRIAGLPDEWRDKVMAAMADKERIPTTQIIRWFRANSLPVDQDGLGDHRHGRCRCAR